MRALALAVALVLAACAPREWYFDRLGAEPPALRDFPKDFRPPVSHETGEAMVGFGGGGGGVHKTPVIFIHGNTVSARFWLPAREYFLQHGYTPDELWALGYGWDNARYFDGNDLSVPSVERIVDSVVRYLSKQEGRPIHQVDVIGHSLGVTLVRQWLKQTNSFHRVRNFIGACGANDGVWTAWPDARGQNRVVSWELAPHSPWLKQLSRGGETPGPTRYMTLYDGTGWGDVLFPKPFEHSSALEGAENLPYNVQHGTWFDHLQLPREPETMHAMIDFLRKAREPLPGEPPPRLVRDADTLKADQADARVHCAAGGAYPDAQTAGAESVALGGGLQTCFARNERTRLSSPLARHGAGVAAATVRAEPAGGVFEQPQLVKLAASDPNAVIVYTTSGTPPNSGSPLYQAPIYVPGPLTLMAATLAPDGTVGAPLRLDFDVSLELIDARHSLERQLDPGEDVRYAGERKKGR